MAHITHSIATRTPSDLSSVSTSSSPAAIRKVPTEGDIHSRSGSDLSHVNEPVSKEHSIDQSSTTVDSHTLSRNTSFSSLSGQTAEKTTEEDQRDRMEDFDQDCVSREVGTQTQLEEHHNVCAVCLQRFVRTCLYTVQLSMWGACEHRCVITHHCAYIDQDIQCGYTACIPIT